MSLSFTLRVRGRVGPLGEEDSMSSTLTTSIPRFKGPSRDNPYRWNLYYDNLHGCLSFVFRSRLTFIPPIFLSKQSYRHRLFSMCNADVLPGEFTVASQHSCPLSAYGHNESLPVLSSVVDHYIGYDISLANRRIITIDTLLVEPGEASRAIEESDAKLTGIVKGQEVPGLHENYCAEMALGMKQNGLSCYLSNHAIRQFEESTILLVWDDPKVIEGLCKSERKPDVVDIRDGHANIVKRLWKGDKENAQPVSGRAGQRHEGGREGADEKGTDGNEEKGVNRFVSRDRRDIQYVPEFKKKHNIIHFGTLRSLPVPTLSLKGPIGSVNGKVFLAGDIDDLLKDGPYRRRTMFLDEAFKPANRICRAIAMERLVPLRYVKSVDHFKQAIRDVVLAHHIAFSNELRIPHRDINIDSLMVRYCDANTLSGVLIDFDLAMMFGEIIEDHMGMQTRSRPFMAWELLESDPPPIHHLERFDWESFFFVICWIGCRYSEGKLVNRSALSHWYESDDETLALIKRASLLGPHPPQRFTPFYDTLVQDWIRPLPKMFYAGCDAWCDFDVGNAQAGDYIPKEEFDEVSLGGHVTWDRFWAILQN